MPSERPETHQDVTRWRQIMYQPSSVWLATDMSGERWLTDEYVMLNVTGDAAQEDVEDGAYKLLASGELRVEKRDSFPEPDLERYFARVDELVDWREATPTEWSVAEHPGKAMLWRSDGAPCLLGESTWTAIHRRYAPLLVEYSHGKLNLFRFTTRAGVFAFAAGIRVPTGQEEIAASIVIPETTRIREEAA